MSEVIGNQYREFVGRGGSKEGQGGQGLPVKILPPPVAPKAAMNCHLCSTMCDSRLSNIAVLSIESALAESLSLDTFVDEFDSKHQNRKLALH